MSGTAPRQTPLTALVDHTLLKPEADEAAVIALCAEAEALGVWSVCVNGSWVATAAEALRGSTPLVCTVVGFPLGSMASQAKAQEAAIAVGDGASEVDMVIHVGLAIDGRWGQVSDDIGAVRTAIDDQADGVTLKVIVESAALDETTLIGACRAAVESGADFVKTSTGFHPAGGATVEAVEVMRRTVGPSVGVKASGGIRTLADAETMLRAGATRLGLSGTRSIVEELRSRG